jgi:uncharacterized protein YjbI with pentapeptide repeats
VQANLQDADLHGAVVGPSYSDRPPIPDQFKGANLSNAIWIDGRKYPPGAVGGDACEAKPH